MRKLLQRLVVWLAFAAALFAPALARAALVPECDAHEQLTRVPAPLVPERSGDEACALAALAALDATADEIGDVRIAAMCDARGASVIAPQRILPIADARLEAGGGPGADASAPAVGPGSEHPSTSSPPVALADHGVLDAACLIPPASSGLAPPYPPVGGGPRIGFGLRIDHPPR